MQCFHLGGSEEHDVICSLWFGMRESEREEEEEDGGRSGRMG